MIATHLRHCEVLIYTYHAMKDRHGERTVKHIQAAIFAEFRVRVTWGEVNKALHTLRQISMAQEARRGYWYWIPSYAREGSVT